MHDRRSLFIILAFIATYFIWGSTYLFNKIVVSEIPPFFASGFRFFIAGMIVFFLVFTFQINFSVEKRQIYNTVIAGILFLGIGNGGVMWALQYVDSGFTALIISAQPLVLLLQMWIHQGKRIQMVSWIGVILGMLGIYLLVSQEELVYNNAQWKGLLVIFICLLSWGYGSIFVSRANLPKNHFLNTGMQMMVGGVVLFFGSILFGENIPDLLSLDNKMYYSMLFLIVFGSIIAFTSFNFLLKHVSPEKVSTNTYVNPIVALMLGYLVLGEVITLQSIIAAAILLMGVYFIKRKKEVA